MRTIGKLQPFWLDVQVPSEDLSEYAMSNDKTPPVLLKVKTFSLKLKLKLPAASCGESSTVRKFAIFRFAR
jgi:hypothetical protein